MRSYFINLYHLIHDNEPIHLDCWWIFLLIKITQDLDSSKNDWIRGKLLKETDDSSWHWDLSLGSIESSIHPKLCNPSSKCSTVFPGICFSCRGEREVRRKGTKNLRSTCSKGSREKREKRKREREEGKESLKSRTVKKNASVKAFWIEGAHARWRW